MKLSSFFPMLSALWLAGLHCAPAATVSVTVNSNGGPMLATSGGQMLEFGDAVRVGYFAPADLAFIQSSTSYKAVNDLFKPLAEGWLDSGDVTQAGNSSTRLFINDGLSAGHIFGQVEDIQETYLAEGSRLYLWAFNDSDPLAATEWGIFGAATGWEFPAGNGAVVLSTFEVTDTPDQVVWGSYESGQLRLGAVPEPASLTLLALAGVLQRRRRPLSNR